MEKSEAGGKKCQKIGRFSPGNAFCYDFFVMHWWVFALALLIVLAVTSVIVLARSWRAAQENPVNSLYKE